LRKYLQVLCQYLKNVFTWKCNTHKYCDNTCEYHTCRWTHFPSIGSILVSIISILTSIDTILASIEQVNRPYNFEFLQENSMNAIGKRVKTILPQLMTFLYLSYQFFLTNMNTRSGNRKPNLVSWTEMVSKKRQEKP